MDLHDHGLAYDLQVIHAAQLQRRRLLLGLAAMGSFGLLGCGGSDSTTPSTTTTTGTATAPTTTTTTTAACSVIPEETAGPYPADGSNTANGSLANALALTGIVRSDIRSSFAGATGIADGVPLTVTIKLVNTNASCADLSGWAVYLWHCDREGRYSMYSSGVTNQNYLRGLQESGTGGTVTFTTIFPGCYSGRMPHIHFEVYRNANSAASYSNKLKTSQIALPTDVCTAVYNSAAGYGASVANLNQTSFATDNVFSDGVTTQLATMSGSVAAGYAALLTVGISA